MVKVKFMGPQGVPLAGRFIYPGEEREVSERELARARKAHPKWFEVVGETLTPASAETSDISDPLPEGEGGSPEFGNDVEADVNDVVEAADVSSVEHVDQPVAKRRGGSKRRTK